MAKSDLLKQAIADAKAVKETALANAKIALQEAFAPRLQSMLSARLAEEAEDDEMYAEEEEMDAMETNEEEYMEDGQDGTPASGLDEEEEIEEEGLDLESIIRELEGEMNDDDNLGEGEEDPEMEVEPAEEEPVAEGEDEEDIDINEIIRSLTEEDGEDEDEAMKTEAEEETSKELEEAYKVIKFMRSKLNEVNLLNAKLLFSNKLFRNYALNEGQKMKVIENFDRASSIREVKLVYSTLCESLKSVNKKKTTIKEGYASKSSGKSTAPKKEILSEGDALAARWKKLANLK